MNIIICGAGEVGRYAAEVLAGEGHNITVIDLRREQLATLEEKLDVRTLEGSGTHAEVLRDAGCANADLFLAATSQDEINLLSASIATGVGAARTIARVHHSAYFEGRGLDYARHLGVDHLVCPEYSTALAITAALRSPAALEVEQFARGRIEMQQLATTAGAPAVGKTLAEVGLPGSVRLAVIERDGTPFLPAADTVIHVGDIVSLVGDVDAFERASRLFHAEQARRSRISIFGGTSMAVWLARALHSRNFSVRLFEQNPQRCEELAEKLDWVTVIRVDTSDATGMDEEYAQSTDAFVALTDDDEHNILSAARAKSLGVPKAIAVLQRPIYLHLLKHVGIDRAFSPRVVAVNQMTQMLRHEPVRHLASLAPGIAEVYEVAVAAQAKDVVGKPLRRVHMPARLLIAAIQRGDDVYVPSADDTIAAGDTLVVIGPSDLTKMLRKTFAPG